MFIASEVQMDTIKHAKLLRSGHNLLLGMNVLPSRTLMRTLHVSAISRIKIFQTDQREWSDF